MKVFNSTSLTGACSEVAKEIIVNYIPPVFQYSILCSKLFTTGTVCVVTGGNPVAFAAFIHIGRLIVEAYQGDEMKIKEFDRIMRQTLDKSGVIKHQIPNQEFDSISK